MMERLNQNGIKLKDLDTEGLFELISQVEEEHRK